jgi:glycosyltransferase involved in cell wall biosynthesis
MIYQAIRKTTSYIANTGYEAQYVIKRGMSPERVHVVGVGVDPEPFQCVNQLEAKSCLGLEDVPVIGFIGQLGGHKGVDTLIRSMPYVWDVVPEARLLIAGARTTFAKRIDKLIKEFLGHDEYRVLVRYNFPEDEKAMLMNAVDVFAYPSGFESFGIAYLEAWAAGKPVIGCRRGAVPWVIDAGRDGLLIEYQNEIMLAETIVMLLRNQNWAHSLGEQGRNKVLARYTWPEIVRQFRSIYKKSLHTTQSG